MTKLDIIIIGGGIAGLWTLNRAIAKGYSAILLEKSALGCGQTVKSQGIIHGGTKYALSGVLSPASSAVKAMPQRWQQCLEGSGEIDLQGIDFLSEAHYLWSTRSIGSKLTTFFASKAMHGRIEEVTPERRPKVFQSEQFRGGLYRLNEFVLNVPQLLRQLAEPVNRYIFQLDAKNLGWHRDEQDCVSHLTLPNGETISASSIVITSGEGYRELADTLEWQSPAMQCRPLHMVSVKHRQPLPLFAHCITGGTRPEITVTSHPHKDGSMVWYLGGNLAEQGIERDAQQQISASRKLLNKLLPWVNLEAAEWDTLRVNRAEPAQSSLVMPDSAYVEKQGNCIIAWPTKLALTPDLTDKVLEKLAPPQPQADTCLTPLQDLPKPPIASYPWDETR